jgi:hypothetical protein
VPEKQLLIENVAKPGVDRHLVEALAAQSGGWTLEQWLRGLTIPILEEPSSIVPRGLSATAEKADT